MWLRLCLSLTGCGAESANVSGVGSEWLRQLGVDSSASKRSFFNSLVQVSKTILVKHEDGIQFHSCNETRTI